MNKIYVAIKIDGEISTGEVIEGIAEEGQIVVIRGSDENGNPLTLTGTVVDVM